MRFVNVPFLFLRHRIVLHINSNVNNYNIYTEAGSPGHNDPTEVIVVVAPGVVVGSTSTGQPAMSTGSWQWGFDVGSRVILVNKGTIVGAGGDGGNGGEANWGDCYNPSSGSAGGPALSLDFYGGFSPFLTIDNTDGYIFGGGGGGGGGGGAVSSTPSSHWSGGGGGGGGGAGTVGGSGGSGGYASANTDWDSGNNGAGGGSAGGSGGAGGNTQYADGGNGGSGGNYGEAGSSGGSGWYEPTMPHCKKSGASGGAAGNAIETNGYDLIWIGGNTSARVKGAVT